MIRLGHKVAIVEQLEDARKTKRLVKRDVVRVITPGTVVEDALLRENEENLLVGMVVTPQGYGLATVDLSTGKFAATQMDAADRQLGLLGRAGSSLPERGRLPALPGRRSVLSALRWRPYIPPGSRQWTMPSLRPRSPPSGCKAHLGVTSLEAFGCDGLPLATAAAGGVLHYLQSNQISDLAHIVRLSTYDLSSVYGPGRHHPPQPGTGAHAARRAAQGIRIREHQPHAHRDGRPDAATLADSAPARRADAIHDRQDAVQELYHQALKRAALRQTLDGMYDVERLVGRIGFGTANARDLVALRQTLERVPRIQALLGEAESARLCHLNDELDTDTLAHVAALIAQAIVDEPPILLREGRIDSARLRGAVGTATRDRSRGTRLDGPV